jgi:hypothetical protein
MHRKEEHVIDFDQLPQKRAVLSRIGTLRGRYRLELTPYRQRRSDRQNRYYFPCVCKPLSDYLSEGDYDVTTVEQAHAILKERFLTCDVVNKRTGEVIGRRVRSTTELSTVEFAEFVERSRAFLLDFFGIVTVDPDPNWRDVEDERMAG